MWRNVSTRLHASSGLRPALVRSGVPSALTSTRALTAASALPAPLAGRLVRGVSARSPETAVADILYNFPPLKKSVMKRHILSVLVDNEPGVLSKVAGMLSARGFNIESLSVCATDVTDLSRMTIVLQCPDAQMAQAQRQLEDLVNVWAVLELGVGAAVERELLLAKIDCVSSEERASRKDSPNAAAHASATMGAMKTSSLESRQWHRRTAAEIVQLFNGRVVDVGTEHVVVEVCADSKSIDAVLELLRPLGIIEAVRSGSLALSKSLVTGLYAEDENLTSGSEVDDSNLPPG